MGNMFNLFGAGSGKSEGLYIWKKYECAPSQVLTNPRITFRAELTNMYIGTVDFDVRMLLPTDGSSTIPTETIEFLTGFAGVSGSSTLKFITSSNALWLSIENPSNSTQAKSIWDYSETEIEFVISNSLYSSFTDAITMTLDGTRTIPAVVGDFLGYVVSDDETKYPDKAEQGGFYYEKIELSPALFGCTKMEVGTFTPTSDVRTYTANHNLGVIPKYAIVWAESSASYNVRNVQAYNINTGSSGYISVYKSDYYARGDYSGSGTASVSRVGIYASSFSTSYYFQSGKKYTYVLLG